MSKKTELEWKTKQRVASNNFDIDCLGAISKEQFPTLKMLGYLTEDLLVE